MELSSPAAVASESRLFGTTPRADVRRVWAGFKSMSLALRDLESLVLGRKLRHGNHPVLTMCMANATVERDAAGNRKLSKKRATRPDRRHGRVGDGDRRRPRGVDCQGGHRGVDRLSVELPSASMPRRGRPRTSPLLRRACGGKEVDTGALVAQTESLASNSFRALSCRLGHRSGARCVPRSSPGGGISEERHQAVPESLQHMPDEADHGIRHFIEVGVDEVAPVFRVQLRSDARRADEIAEHDRERRGRAVTLTELSPCTAPIRTAGFDRLTKGPQFLW
jgi:hypothetical protein